MDGNHTTRRIVSVNSEMSIATTMGNENIIIIIAPVCRSPKRHTNLTRAKRQGRPGSQPAAQKYIAPADPDSTGDEESLSIHTVGRGTTPPIEIPLIY